MNDTNNLVPKLRFPEFTDEWEQRKLGEIGETYTGLSGKTKEDFGHGNAKFITYMNVYSNAIASLDMTDAIEIDRKQHEVKKGDVFFTTSSETPEEVGMSCVLTEDSPNTYLNSFCFGYRPTIPVSLNYLAYMLRSSTVRNKIVILAQGISRYNISKTKMMDIEVSLPSMEEQEKIGQLFSELDNTIALHQRKLDAMKEYKKGLLQKMFPKNGETVPEIRFPGFTGEWERRKLEELIVEYRETVDSDCTLPVLTSSKSEGVVLQEEHFGRKQNHDIAGYNVLPRNYCTYRNRSDGIDFTFNINKCCDKGIISKFYPVFYGKDSDIEFISLVLNNSEEVVHEIGYTCVGTGQKVLSFSDLKKMNIRVPSIAEQQRVSTFFSSLDNTIALHQRKLDVMKEYKKGLLQQMFC